MEFLQSSIYEHIEDRINGKNKVGIVDILLQMFDAIQSLHENAKVVHRDLKPDNFRIHNGKVKMIDFGLVTEFLDKNGKHYPPGDIGGFLGTLKTGSTSSLQGKNHSRKDDLESLAYTFMFIINPHLVPWKGEKELEKILDKMLAFIATDNSKVPAEFRQIHKFILEVQKLQYV